MLDQEDDLSLGNWGHPRPHKETISCLDSLEMIDYYQLGSWDHGPAKPSASLVAFSWMLRHSHERNLRHLPCECSANPAALPGAASSLSSYPSLHSQLTPPPFQTPAFSCLLYHGPLGTRTNIISPGHDAEQMPAAPQTWLSTSQNSLLF